MREARKGILGLALFSFVDVACKIMCVREEHPFPSLTAHFGFQYRPNSF